MSKKNKNKIDIEITDDSPEMAAEENEVADTVRSEESSEAENDKAASEEKAAEPTIEDYEKKLEEFNDRYLRLAAEFDNYRKRTARQFEDIIKNSNEKLILQILELADNFERALEAVSNSDDYEALKSGTELIYQHLSDILKKERVEPIESIGQKFDPNLHEALMQIDSDEYDEGIVAREIIRGYKLNGKVIRFARVAVSKGKNGENKNETSAEEEQL